jgi:hypothetical protein
MAALTPLKSTTVEDALLELIEQAAELQVATAHNPQNVTVVSNYSRNGLTGAMTATITLPVSSVANTTTGLPELSVTPVFT